jgi:hypothetical protein
MTYETLGVIGAVIAVLLSVNAYFFKDMVKSLKTIELELMKLSTQHDRVEEDVKFLLSENLKVRDRLHQVEGYAKHILGEDRDNWRKE